MFLASALPSDFHTFSLPRTYSFCSYKKIDRHKGDMMMNKKSSLPKMLSWSYGIVIAFTTAYLVGGFLLDKQAKQEHKKQSETTNPT
jgi:hypothetical protein